ncbi:hypothetical protein PYCC9005_002552 [Savitreella phatthalungensis]
MADYIGSRLSLISKSDIRYVGVLHEIDSVNSTVSLENVVSYGTEGRKGGDPSQEIPPSDQVFEYIVFRGSDVKDLRVEQGSAAGAQAPQQQPQQPRPQQHDPAILQSNAAAAAPQQQLNRPPGQQQQHQPLQQGASYGPRPGYGPPQGYGMPMQGYPGQFGAPPPFGAPGPYGMPPQGYPGQYAYPGQQMPPRGPPGTAGHPGQVPGQVAGGNVPQSQPQQQQQPVAEREAPRQPQQPPQQQQQQQRQAPPAQAPKPVESKSQQSSSQTPFFAAQPQNAFPDLPDDVAKAPQKTAGETGSQARVTPALPLPNQRNSAASVAQPLSFASAAAGAAGSATVDTITSGVAGLSASQQPSKRNALLEVDRKMKAPSQPAPPANGARQPQQQPQQILARSHNDGGRRGGSVAGGAPRGPPRGPPQPAVAAPVVVPDADFDFDSANAAFVKEKPATDGASEAAASQGDAVEEPKYNKKSSFFDSLSNESTERAERAAKLAAAREAGQPRGRAMRQEEREMNLETFGEDLAFSAGGRGGRGRGRGGRGGRGRGGRGGRGRGSADHAQVV